MATTALITGATSGIGRAAADKLAQSGVHVMVVGRNVERGERTIAEIRAAGGKADFISSDLRDAASARAVARKAVELGNGHVDILINNAGMFPFGPTHETSEESFDDVYALNVKAPYFLVARQETASGEKFDPNELTAAHPNLPFGTQLRVTNVANGRSVTVRINDRGPFVAGRAVDVSYSAAERIGIIERGVAKVKLDVVQ
jgi:NAD(P)-dependent dehydrogenase (short-subunit alcohol dehydrogenase family)